MGLDLQTVRFIMEAKVAGADFSEVLMLGRQDIHFDRETYRREGRRFGLPLDEATTFNAAPFADGLFTTLGARSVSSVDASDYEGANYVADLNKPVPAKMAGKFSLIVDGGTLEHIFDFPQAMRNVGKMLKVGGTFVSVTCCNNFVGHGFYQLSPELFYRVLSPINGFEVEQMVLTEVNKDGVWYPVPDPATKGGRVTLVNNARTYIMTRARKVADVEMFKTTPQQSDYHDTAWAGAEKPEASEFLNTGGRLQHLVEERFPRFARNIMRRLKQATTNPFASPLYGKGRSF